ncbi:uncharacterized protein [Oryza sativa Japonica Group]|uniref:uncharacterized protein isoform X2 n=1 Tax=Oryza sativa subsp. japonica TaxID=39947 RepID=UPI000E1B6385|nr:uncharacterized protein LOC107280320 isoform X2 [Oryza sativa Japonica Group]
MVTSRTLPEPDHRSDEEDEHERRSRRRHRSRSLWDRLGGRSASRSREPDRGDRPQYNQDNRGRQRSRATDESRSRSRHLSRSVEPGETRLRRQSRESTPAAKEKEIVQDSGAILNLLEKHLDPMLHEASIRNIVYSPDTSSSAPASPVFVLSSVAGNQAPEMVANQSVAADFLNNLSTPMQQPLLKMPKTKKRRPCLNKYKKPLSPAAMKTISALVEKGGCKAIRLNGKGKGKVAQAPATTQT